MKKLFLGLALILAAQTIDIVAITTIRLIKMNKDGYVTELRELTANVANKQVEPAEGFLTAARDSLSNVKMYSARIKDKSVLEELKVGDVEAWIKQQEEELDRLEGLLKKIK